MTLCMTLHEPMENTHTHAHTFALMHTLVQAKKCTHLMPTNDFEWLTECFEVCFLCSGNSC